MSVRVIAGSAKGRRLAVPTGKHVRPTSDRARETLFNVLAPRIAGARLLDVFAGSGAVGIEAISRGAAAVAFVESSRRTITVLRANIELCGFRERAEVIARPWAAGLRDLAGHGERFDIVFCDPPYDWQGAGDCLSALVDGSLLAEGGVAVIEHRRATPPEAGPGWELQRRLDVGDTSFSLFGIISAT